MKCTEKMLDGGRGSAGFDDQRAPFDHGLCAASQVKGRMGNRRFCKGKDRVDVNRADIVGHAGQQRSDCASGDGGMGIFQRLKGDGAIGFVPCHKLRRGSA